MLTEEELLNLEDQYEDALEEEAQIYRVDVMYHCRYENLSDYDIEYAFKAGAKWQREYDKKNFKMKRRKTKHYGNKKSNN